ncbi:MAG: protein-methionine-sulfoxide reductase catalytic subunit MsrP [Anaerolineales bacterium]|nr:protein-methionine-sulfoxide reductase catalytic subunit MsrP [Anaerolineales bacterium]MDW8226997.1 protein-methionine-sulfoxide reductase catalytic subunit MsrP [Anaerolineales bacterium]
MERKLRHIAIPSSEITPKSLYLSRRDWLKAMGIVSAAALLAACLPQREPTPVETGAGTRSGHVPTDELGDPANTFDEITNYNNYYEFSTDKRAVNRLSANFKSTPWAVEVGGLVHKPKTYALEDLLKFEQVERVYRLRCVEGWSMVIPWMGFELNKLLKEVEPMASARYVRFVALLDPEQFPGQRSPFYPWPYTEGLRLDEAMHRLTLIATGLYGELLPNPNGAPLRLVVPWKYGFKSIKAIVRIELTEEQPATLWNTVAPHEYGFYANVNPEVDHPRWSQRTERRIGEIGRRPTLLFNGYGDEVAGLYAGMDLRVNY